MLVWWSDHAPQSGQPEVDRVQWWQELTERLQQLDDGSPIITMLDANAAPGDSDGRCVGGTTVCSSKEHTTVSTVSWIALTSACPALLHAIKARTRRGVHHMEPVSIALTMSPFRPTYKDFCLLSTVVEDFDLHNGDGDPFAGSVAVGMVSNFHRPLQTPVLSMPRPALTENKIQREGIAKNCEQHWCTCLEYAMFIRTFTLTIKHCGTASPSIVPKNRKWTQEVFHHSGNLESPQPKACLQKAIEGGWTQIEK